MRTRDDIDAELRLLVAVRRSIREQDGDPPSRQIDELVDERGQCCCSVLHCSPPKSRKPVVSVTQSMVVGTRSSERVSV